MLKTQSDCIKEMEQILPAKANKQDVAGQLAQKANLFDVKKTMAEVAANIESRVSLEEHRQALDEKASKSDLQLYMQEKVSFDDLKKYMGSNGGSDGKGGLGGGTGPGGDRHFELVEEEMRRLKDRVEDTYHQLQSVRQMGGGPSSSRDFLSFQKEVNAKFIEIEEKLTEKANKHTVAQALHRKANKPELEAILAKKVDFEDLQRILDAKVDISSFQNLVRTVDYKADKHELIQNSATQNQSQEQSTNLERAELEKLLNLVKQSSLENDERLAGFETKISELQNEAEAGLEKLRSQVTLAMQQKTEFQDLEAVAHKLHAKADFEQVQELIGSLKTEMVAQLSSVKKEMKKKSVKKSEDSERTKQEQEFANEKMFEEVRNVKDKLTRLANQFDKELVERDKSLKQFQAGLWDDIQAMLASIQQDTHSTNKLCQDLANMKADKKELAETRQKLSQQLQDTITASEFTSSLSTFNSDNTQRMLDLRSEVFARVAELNTQCMDAVAKKANHEDFRALVEEKVDTAVLKTYLNQKLGLAEFDALKGVVERMQTELQAKAPTRELETMNDYLRSQLDSVAKELLLRVSIKDMCTLLDQKANLADVNKTLELVQREVEECVKEPQLKEALNDQALVNEALCAENCVGRWVWKSGDLHNQGLVPWEAQAINTCPDNFLWEKNKSTLILAAPGLYQISFGFYSKKPPTVQVYVNNEAILTVRGD